MSTLHFRNAKIFAGGYDLSGDFNATAVEYSAEMLDETAFGDSTRTRKGGLTIGNVTGSGHWDAAPAHIDAVVFGLVGVDGTVVFVFPNGVSEGTSTDMGFAMQGVVEKYPLKGNVGALLQFDVAIMGRGIEA